MSLRISFSCLAESLTHSLERSLVDLAIVLDDVDGLPIMIGESCDFLGSLGPAHQISFVLEGLGEDDSLTRNHIESVDKCSVIKCCTTLIVDILTKCC